MNRLLIAVPIFLLIAAGLVFIYSLQNQPLETTGQIIGKAFIPSSPIQGMAYDRLEKAISENKTALIFFYNNSCDVCIAQIAEIESLMDYLNANNPSIFQNFTYYEYDYNLPDLRSRLNVTHHHTLILIKEGKEILRTREAMTKDELLKKITGG